MRAWIQIIGPAITFFGVLLSIWGTFQLTKWYYPFGAAEFAKSVFKVTFLSLTGRRQRAIQLIKVVTRFGELNKERRANSLIGLCLIFVGFSFQAVGALCWGADMIWGIIKDCSG